MKCRVCSNNTIKYTRKFISIPEDNNLFECYKCGCLNREKTSQDTYETGNYRQQQYNLYNDSFSVQIDFWGIENGIKKGLWLKNYIKQNFKLNTINWVIDVGGYTGFVGYIVSKHFKVVCYLDEIDKNGPKIGKLLKNDLIIKKKKLTNTGLIIFSQVLEHIEHPSLFLKKKLEKIKNNSFIYIEVPNSTNFPNVDPDHLIDFSKEGMILIAEKNNLKLIKHWCDGEPMTTFRWDNNKRKHCFLFKKVSALNEIQKINFKIKNHSNRKRIAVLKNIPFWLKKCNIKQVILACLDLLGISSLLLKLSRPFN